MCKGLFFLFFFISLSASATTFYARDFGVKGDGITDDGPALRKAITALTHAQGENTLVFEPRSRVYVKNFKGIYLFDFQAISGLTIEGKGSVFLLDGRVRFLSLKSCSGVTINDLSIDYTPLPFADGEVVAINRAARYIDVRIAPGYAMPPLGGPTKAPAEQAYFGMLWNKGPYSLLGTHYWIKDVRLPEKGSLEQRIVRVEASPEFTDWNAIQAHVTQISVPVRGIAHMGPHEVIRVVESDNVYFNRVNVWSAPWFAVGVARNKGEVRFKEVNIVPKPGTHRLTSSWRDGFHVSSNYARLLWEDCRVEGTNDDAFNIQSFTSTLLRVKSGNTITIRQNFPLDIVPYPQGDSVSVFDPEKGIILGGAKVSTSTGFDKADHASAPEITLVLDKPIQGMNPGCQVWNESSANPHTLLRHCQIYNSCRFQSPVTIASCDITALAWFYGDNIEGPIPSHILIKNSRLFVGRGNSTAALVFSVEMTKNGVHFPSTKQAIADVILQDNVIDGQLRVSHVDHISLFRNKFLLPRSKVIFEDCRHILMKDNFLGNIEINHLNQINFLDSASRASATVVSDVK